MILDMWPGISAASTRMRAALNHVFNQRQPHVQVHTHICNSDIVQLWSDVGVDVASIEFSRSKDDRYIRQVYERFGDGNLQIGPGVSDGHSPHTPGEYGDGRAPH